jgi:thioredoxin reductase (NADPH)
VRRPFRHLFLFTGAEPNTDWLAGFGVALDAKGFVLTGNGRPLETSIHGVFAIGDVRSGSVKRVAASVDEGAQVVAALHDFLAAWRRERASRRISRMPGFGPKRTFEWRQSMSAIGVRAEIKI